MAREKNPEKKSKHRQLSQFNVKREQSPNHRRVHERKAVMDRNNIGGGGEITRQRDKKHKMSERGVYENQKKVTQRSERSSPDGNHESEANEADAREQKESDVVASRASQVHESGKHQNVQGLVNQDVEEGQKHWKSKPVLDKNSVTENGGKPSPAGSVDDDNERGWSPQDGCKETYTAGPLTAPARTSTRTPTHLTLQTSTKKPGHAKMMPMGGDILQRARERGRKARRERHERRRRKRNVVADQNGRGERESRRRRRQMRRGGVDEGDDDDERGRDGAGEAKGGERREDDGRLAVVRGTDAAEAWDGDDVDQRHLVQALPKSLEDFQAQDMAS
ncbi:uncharacterized protein STEHIDRAFT_108074 [Stereum hirsutum FP-91666 SS1]|uniref:uncharacterized protein n=1 Tax=Stereum hirsutum (strain FP-91666) TaxID=721885 RepID=UPI000440E395|nr:uncharacterized protein STEHIDRAFT_108074 [Stereum hirsutum FP-91666 SS1]EIM91544.1 hypothetical protein STEHIDRAFT_108074 [Stereum hirsutum FP-91666 SS1]